MIITEAIYEVRESHNCPRTFDTYFTCLRYFLPIFLVSQTVGGRGAAEGNKKPFKPFSPTQYCSYPKRNGSIYPSCMGFCTLVTKIIAILNSHRPRSPIWRTFISRCFAHFRLTLPKWETKHQVKKQTIRAKRMPKWAVILAFSWRPLCIIANWKGNLTERRNQALKMYKS